MTLASGQLIIQKTDAAGDTTDIPWYAAQGVEVWLETDDLNFGTHQEKYVGQIVVLLDGNEDLTDVTVEVGYKDRLKDSYAWIAPQSLVNADDPLCVMKTARWFKLRFRDVLVRSRWQLHGVEFHGQIVGGN